MSDSPTVTDVLDESERSSIRGTLMQLAQQQVNASRRSSAINIDAYMRECNIWIKRGMTREQVCAAMDAKLGLQEEEGVFVTKASNKISHIACQYSDDGRLQRVSFVDETD